MDRNPPRIGLLGLYIELYDRAVPHIRPRIDGFYATIADALRGRSLDVLTAPLARTAQESASTVAAFERGGADLLVTLHLAYSPSLESIDALAAAKLPLVVLDTTPTFAYGPDQDPEELLYNHGIHGVQDLCNLLLRRGKPFEIVVGHWERSGVLDRVAGWARAAQIASAMRSARVGLLGEPFPGMGDFAVPHETLQRTIGIETVRAQPADLAAALPREDAPDVAAEIAADRERYDAPDVPQDAHVRTTQACLAVRRWAERERLTAFTVNFGSVDRASGLPVMPFLEASKAMERGLGYAGEGDVLTAALVGALGSTLGDTTFTEMFCPDWQGDRIYLSHMGEVNPALLAGQPCLRVMPFPWTDADDPVFAVGCLRPGPAVLVDLAPRADDRFALIVCPVEVRPVEGEDRMRDAVHGWFRPRVPIADFLAEYSRAGGTHHLALVYGDATGTIARFGSLAGWQVAVLDR